ncbi:MAG TPA: hydrophobe/amphiphile efflux-1 family RND transporter, partial [Planctomycetaceae bacterium]|nr:hydrophobe/amphiphile efflux-1 family RND transporter [Planctomycetaceae bacterium]
EERVAKGITQEKILASIQQKLAPIQEAVVFAFPPPPIRGLGMRGGFEMQVEDRTDAGLQVLQEAAQAIVADANSQSALQGVTTSFRPGVPQLYLEIDREKAKTLNVPLGNIFTTLQAFLGSTYVNDFNKFGRTYQVRVQADQEFRAKPEDIERLEVRTSEGKMLPLRSLITIKKSFGPQVINRYNLYPAATVSGGYRTGYSSGDALRIMEQVADENLSNSLGYEWTGTAFQEKRVGSESIFIFGVAILLVYLVLAAQYESWLLPVAVILVVPLGLLGAVAAVAYRGMEINIYTQIGIVLIIALASKNAILIV